MKTQPEQMWVDWIVNMMIPRDVQEKIHRTHRLTHDELLLVNRASCAVSDIKAILARFPKSGTLSTDESMAKLAHELELRLKKHITERTKLPKNVINYFVQNSELDDGLKGLEDNSDIRVSGVKLQMREIACTLIDDYDAIPVRAADAVFEYFKGKPEAYDNKLSFRSTMYQHYEISRGCKPVTKSNPVRDLEELRKIIPILL